MSSPKFVNITQYAHSSYCNPQQTGQNLPRFPKENLSKFTIILKKKGGGDFPRSKIKYKNYFNNVVFHVIYSHSKTLTMFSENNPI